LRAYQRPSFSDENWAFVIEVSGYLTGKTKRRGVAATAAVVNELASAESGAIVFSSSTGRQYSQENPKWGNGAFTKGLVEGISGKAD
jgi:hypothetical protein